MSSYQKRLQNIKYLRQCVLELEEICFELAAELPRPKVPNIKLRGSGKKGSDFLTPYNMGEFDFKIFQAKHKS